MEKQPSLDFMHGLMKGEHHYRFLIKSWGFEYWFENNKQYCGKIIQVREGEWSSYGAFHYHKIKDETFLCLSGDLKIDIMDMTRILPSQIINHNAIVARDDEDEPYFHRFLLHPYDYIRLKPGVLHRFSGLGGEAMFTETSTTHKEEDSYRIETPDANDQLHEITKAGVMANELPRNTEKFSYQSYLDEEIFGEEK